jgi:hypothetical protein
VKSSYNKYGWRFMRIPWLLLFFLFTTVHAQRTDSKCPTSGTAGEWSLEATFLCPQYVGRDYTRDMRVESPNRQATVRVGYDTWWLEVDGKRFELSSEKARVTENAELGWTPDGTQFYVTQSENRAGVQGYHTEAYRIRNGRIEILADVNELVQRAFDRHHECVFYDRGKRFSEEADIGGLKWVENELLVVAEVPYDSDCDRGYFAGYLVSLSQRKVIHRYSARQLMARWESVLGDRLKEDFRNLTVNQKDALP